MVNLNKKCKHYNDDGRCRLLAFRRSAKAGLTPVRCDGWDNKCKFAKTEVDFILDNDKSIDICRRKGLCDNCKYTKVKCKLSTEG